LDLSLDLIQGFSTIAARQTSSRREYRRSILILEINKSCPFQASKHCGCYKQTAYRWYQRTKALSKELKKSSKTLSSSTVEKLLRLMLKDLPRNGGSLTYTPEQQCEIIKETVEQDPEAEWIFVSDQLNTHKSASLVKLAGGYCTPFSGANGNK
jgi:hypothetical protein